MKVLRVTEIVKEIKFEGALCDLEAKYCLRRQSWPKHFKKTVVFL